MSATDIVDARDKSRGGEWTRTVLVLLGLGVVAIVLWVWWSFFSLREQQTLRVLFSTGDFAVDGTSSRQGDPQSAAGKGLSTGADGFATVRLSDGSVLKLAPNSTLNIEQARTNAKRDRVSTRLRLVAGTIESRIAEADGRDREISLFSKSVAVGVRGTIFTLQDTGSAARLTVSEGEVEASAANRSVSVRANQGTVIETGRAPQEVSTLLRSPRTVVPLPGASAGEDSLHFAWNPVPQAVAYVVELAEDMAFNRVLRRFQVSWTTGSLPPLARDGRYFWRAASVDARGLRGRFGKPLEFVHEYYHAESRNALQRLDLAGVHKNLARARESIDGEIDRLRARGFREITQGQHAAAKATFETILKLRPGDDSARNGIELADYHLLDDGSARERYQ